MLVHWIWLATRPGVGDRMKAVLVQHFRDPEDIFCAEPEALSEVEGLTEQAVQSLLDRDLEGAEQILADCRREKLSVLTYGDASYPQRLRNIIDPPLVLYYKGQLPQLDEVPVIAVVGTRKATLYGLNTAGQMGRQIAASGGIVVSGMAAGIDSAAMTGALATGQPVVGVLGCGADLPAPASKRDLFAKTREQGCIFSEFPPGTRPAKWTYPKRNRIISGLSNGVLVVEAPVGSGALITARLAAEQGRDLFVVPGNIDMPSFAGSNALLREGAGAAFSGWDILSEYEAFYPDKLCGDPVPELSPAPAGEAKVAQKPRRPEKKLNLKKELDSQPIDKPGKESYSDVDDTQLSPEERAVLAAVQGGAQLTDDVIAATGLSTGQLLTALTMLELKGIIGRLPGKRITLM